jgi:hypothetical protein
MSEHAYLLVQGNATYGLPMREEFGNKFQLNFPVIIHNKVI